MAEVSWFFLSSPGDVFGAAATAEGISTDGPPAIAVYTEGGHVYTRGDDGTGWKWEHLGAPPGGPNVSALGLLTIDAAGTIAPVVVGMNDGQSGSVRHRERPRPGWTWVRRHPTRSSSLSPG